jgi:cysteine synthase
VPSIRAYGAELRVVADGVDYMDEANRLARENGWYDVDQYDNLANMRAHQESMAPEIFQQTEGTVTHFVAGGSTGGTVSGVGKGLKAVKPGVQIILADPVGSVFAPMFETGKLVEQGKFLVEGVGKGNIRAWSRRRDWFFLTRAA